MVRIGFEIHVQLKTNSKLFCSCSTQFLEAEPNSQICPVCTAQPGSKPEGLNEEVVRRAVEVALALDCEPVNTPLRFLRKHYFYPDLPNNFQRTSDPIAVNGELSGVRIREIHIEEDPGRYELRGGLVDFNRSGVPLIEIVTEPDLNSVEDAREFLRHLRAVLDCLGVMLYPEIGFRVDANVSVEGGERVEVKNINSIQSVVRALKFEILRHKKVLGMGGRIKRETRHWDEARGITVSLREKETAEDYRYIADPDIPPYCVSASFVEAVRESLPELPHQKKERLMREFGIDGGAAWTFALDKELSTIFEELAKDYGVRKALSFCLHLRGELNYRNKCFAEVEGRDRFYNLADLYFAGKITKPTYVEYVRRALDDPGFKPREEEQLGEKELREIAEDVLQANPGAVRDYKTGEKKALNFLVGQIISKAGGKVHPRDAVRILEDVLRAS